MPPTPPAARLLLAAIVESSEDAIISKDLTGIITSWNRGAERAFGYTAGEAVGRSITMLIPGDRLAEEDHVLARVARGESVDHFETIRQRKDGTLVDVSLTVSPIRDENGTIIGASKIARDVTARRRMETELQDLQRRLVALASASGTILGSPTMDDVLAGTIAVARDLFAADGYAVWRTEDHATWKVVRSFGISDTFRTRVVIRDGGHASGAIVPPEPMIFEDVSTEPRLAGSRDAYEAEGIASMVAFPLAVRGHRSGTIVFYFRRRRTFQRVDVEVGTALANLAASALSTAELYEEQRAAREAADHARHRAAFLADAATILSASLDYQDTLSAVARLAVTAVADWCAVDMIGEGGIVHRLAVAHLDPAKVRDARELEERYPADPDMEGGVHHVIRTGQPVLVSRILPSQLEAASRDEEHHRMLRAFGLTSYMCVPMLAHGKAFAAMTFLSAESGREYTDTDLRLAREIAARASLAVENARSYARAQDANRLKDEFLATLSHELRTPLNAVLGYARMLRLGTLNAEKGRTAVEVIERNATSLKQIIEDVLDVSRIVTGRLRLSVQPVDLPVVLREACATVMPAADAKGVRVETILDPLTAPVSGDVDRLQQVVWNLLSNAIKFTPRGGKVQVRLSRVNSHVEITVSDTGCGIAPSFLPAVFDRFRQGDATPSREHGGLGLGLSIAKQLIELHGGTIEAASDGEGKGATFTAKLPLMIVHARPAEPGRREQPHTDHHPPVIDGAPRLDGVRVLAVDDEPDSLNLLRFVLESAGAEVRVANSAAAALDAIRQHVPDVMIADIGMPGVDGLQLVRAVRQLEKPARNIPIAALTAYARTQDRVLSLASGFQMHLVKPIDPLELTVAVSALASGQLNT
jgi:PAS domain S-box-containing protein